MTVMVSVTWTICSIDRKHDDPENELTKKLWDRLRRIANTWGEEFWIAARAPEYDFHNGNHIHMGLRLPPESWAHVIKALERITGAPATAVHLPEGKTIRRKGQRTCSGVLAIGQNGSWMMQRNLRAETSGTSGILTYGTKAPKSAEVMTQFRLSRDVLQITRTILPNFRVLDTGHN